MGCRVITGNETKGCALLIEASPSFVPPMLATRVQKLPTGPGWEYEVKWDGYRIVAVKSGGRVQLFSRRGASYTDKFRAVTRAVASVHADTAVLDGEVVATDALGRPSFQVLQNRGRLPAGHQVVYYVFDLLFLDGEDLKGKRLVDRRDMLAGVVEGTRVLFSASLNGGLNAILGELVGAEWGEGAVEAAGDSEWGWPSGWWRHRLGGCERIC